MNRRLFFLLSFVSVFIICSISFIPSAQSSLVEEGIKSNINNIVNLFDNFLNLIILWLISALPISIIHILLILINGVSISIEGVFGLYYFYLVAPYFIYKLILNLNDLTWDYIKNYIGPGFFYYLFIGFLEIVFILKGLKKLG